MLYTTSEQGVVLDSIFQQVKAHLSVKQHDFSNPEGIRGSHMAFAKIKDGHSKYSTVNNFVDDFFRESLDSIYSDQTRNYIQAALTLAKEALEKDADLTSVSHRWKVLQQSKGHTLEVNKPIIRTDEGLIVFDRMQALNLSLRELADQCGVSYQTVSNWQKNGPGIYKSQCYESLGLDTNGGVVNEIPPWLELKRETEKASIAHQINRLSAIEKILTSRGKPRASGTAQKEVMRLFGDDEHAMIQYASKIELYSRADLDTKYKELGSATQKLRKYWDISGKSLLERSPCSDGLSIAANTLKALENDKHRHGLTHRNQNQDILTPLKEICNLLGAIYTVDQQQPDGKRLFDGNMNLEFITFLMQHHADAPEIQATTALGRRINKGISDVITASEKIAPLITNKRVSNSPKTEGSAFSR